MFRGWDISLDCITDNVTATAQYDDYLYGATYTLNSEGDGYILSGYDYVDVDPNNSMILYLNLRIPETYNGLPITEIGESVFRNYKYLSSVYIPKTIVKINDWAFSTNDGFVCRRVKFATDSNLTIIGAHVFEQYSNLTASSTLVDLVIPRSVREIGTDSFMMVDYYSDQCVYLEFTSPTEYSNNVTLGSGVFRMWMTYTDWMVQTSNYRSFKAYFYSETKPTNPGSLSYWHYVAGTPTPW